MREIDQIVHNIPDIMFTEDNGNEVTVIYKSGARAVVTACVGEHGNQWRVVGHDPKGKPFDSGVIRLGAVLPALGGLGNTGYYGNANGDTGEEFFIPEIEKIIKNSYLDNLLQVSYPRINVASIYYDMPYEKIDLTRGDDHATVIAETGEHLGLWRVIFPENEYGPASDSGPIPLNEIESRLAPRQSFARTKIVFDMSGDPVNQMKRLEALDAAEDSTRKKDNKKGSKSTKTSWWAKFSKIFR